MLRELLKYANKFLIGFYIDFLKTLQNIIYLTHIEFLYLTNREVLV